MTNGKFTRDEWNNLLHLCQYQPSQLHLLYQEFQLDKLLHNGEEDSKSEEERVVSKSRPAVMNMSSYFISTSSSAASSPIASKSPGMPIASEKPDSRTSVEPSSFDTASTSQVRLEDAYLGGLMEEQRKDTSNQEENSEDSDNPAAGAWYFLEETVAKKNNKAWGKPLAHGASSSGDQESQKNTEATWDHHLHISPGTSHHIGSRLLHGQEDLWITTRRSCGRLECVCGCYGECS